jgi:Asp-tRNA(Asn)/Glu-tRNA(Gln) amidotransferase A subunit family amidase
VVGWKPSYGQLSLQGVFPLAHPLDHPGVIAGTVEDCLIASSALGGATLSGIEDLPAPRAIACLDDPLMEETAIEYQEAVAEFVRRAARRGITCERKTLDRPIRDYFREFSEILATCASTHLEGAFGSDLSALPSRIQQLAMEGQKLRTSERRATVGPIADRGLDRLRSVAGRELIEPGTVVVCPPAPALPPDRSSTGNPIWNAVWSLLGLPTLTFPMGWTTDGLPVGVQVVARQGEDALLFGAGKWLGG